MAVAVELIPDVDPLHRLIDSPPMFDDVKGLLWDLVFQFPGGQYESVIWGKYAPSEERVHDLGRAREAGYRLSKPERHYVGFIASTAAAVRSIRTAAGHGFSVCHRPEEGLHHAGIAYRPLEGRSGEQLNRNEKNELKLALRIAFGPLVRPLPP